MTTAALPPTLLTTDQPNVLGAEQIAFYREHGYLHIPSMFTPQETDELAEHLEWLIETWAIKDQGWTGPWRKKYMDAATEQKSKLIALHDLQYYSDAWSRAVVKPRLAGAMGDLIGPALSEAAGSGVEGPAV